ncbi:MAG: hypothetical protein ACYTBJ_08295 [Planctomycetota bacterium]|jgi:hypothetical protein
MYKSIAALLLMSLACGCSATKLIRVPAAGVAVIDYGPDRRGSYILTSKDGKHVIVSEPSPDVAKQITSSLGLSAKTFGQLEGVDFKAKYADEVVDLARRGQTLQVLRECLFRLSEMGASSDISPEQRVDLYIKVLDTITVMEATKLVSVGGASGMDPNTLEGLLKDVLPGTVKIPQE